MDVQPRPIPLTRSDTIRRWWANVEQCSGQQRSIERTDFFVLTVSRADGVSTKHRTPGYVWAGASVGREKIIIGLPWLTDSAMVEHEMGHVIASPGWHDPEIFQRRCKDQVRCVATCLTDTVPPLPRAMADRS